jgi:Zn-dependent protease with chaperone function
MFFLAQCANVIVPEATEQAMRYYESGNLLWIVSQAWGLLIPLLFLFTGLSGKLEIWAHRWGKNWFFTIVCYLVLFVVIYSLLEFPLDFYKGYVREHEYGLSTQSLGRWFGNAGKTIGVMLIGLIATVWIFYLLLKKSPKRWWLYGSFAAIGISFFLMLIQPIWIDPLFNTFGPMKNKALEQKILNLASRAGIQDGRVMEVDMSQDTKGLNAYVIGLGSTNRIVLWDTTIAKLPEDQLLFVMGHEMGHYVLHHIWWGFLFTSLLFVFLFYLTYKTSSWILTRYQGRFGFHAMSQIASLPLFFLLFSFFSLLTTPLSNYVSRVMEHQADQFGLEITQNNQAAGEAFVTLQEENLANPRPGPIFKCWRSTHPPVGERIDYCNSYCPWSEGKPLRFGDRFSSQN